MTTPDPSPMHLGLFPYELSPNGELRRNGKLIKPSMHKGYARVRLQNGRLSLRAYVHVLVATVFIGDPPGNHRVVNHIDGNKTNNHYANLEWVTMSENTKHAYNNKLASAKKGSEHASSLVKAEFVPIIWALRKRISSTIVGAFFGVSGSAIRSIWNEKNWVHITGKLMHMPAMPDAPIELLISWHHALTGRTSFPDSTPQPTETLRLQCGLALSFFVVQHSDYFTDFREPVIALLGVDDQRADVVRAEANKGILPFQSWLSTLMPNLLIAINTSAKRSPLEPFSDNVPLAWGTPLDNALIYLLLHVAVPEDLLRGTCLETVVGSFFQLSRNQLMYSGVLFVGTETLDDTVGSKRQAQRAVDHMLAWYNGRGMPCTQNRYADAWKRVDELIEALWEEMPSWSTTVPLLRLTVREDPYPSTPRPLAEVDFASGPDMTVDALVKITGDELTIVHEVVKTRVTSEEAQPVTVNEPAVSERAADEVKRLLQDYTRIDRRLLSHLSLAGEGVHPDVRTLLANFFGMKRDEVKRLLFLDTVTAPIVRAMHESARAALKAIMNWEFETAMDSGSCAGKTRATRRTWGPVSLLMRDVVRELKNHDPALPDTCHLLKTYKGFPGMKALPPIGAETCHASMDGECSWDKCPQIRDKEPETSGRHCPLDDLEQEW